MKKTFNFLFLIIWPAVILSQFGFYQDRQSVSLEPLSIPLEVTETPVKKENKIEDRLAIVSEKLNKIKFQKITKKKIKQVVQVKQASVVKTEKKKNEIKKTERKTILSDYSPRVSPEGVEITPALTLLEIKNQLEENRKRKEQNYKVSESIQATPKKLNIKDEKINHELVVTEINNEEVKIELESNELSGKNIISHQGFKVEKPKIESMLALLQKTQLQGELEKLADLEKRRIETEKIEKDIKSVAGLPNERRVAALNKPKKEIPNVKEEKPSDEMIFLDYSKEEKELIAEEEKVIENLQKKLANKDDEILLKAQVENLSSQNDTVYNHTTQEDEAAISSLVKEAISREMELSKEKVRIARQMDRPAPMGPRPAAAKKRGPAILNSQLANNQLAMAMNTQPEPSKKVSIQNYQPVNPTRRPAPKNLNQQDMIKSALAATMRVEEEGGNSRTLITANEIVLNSSEDNLLNSYELAPSHDLNERYTDENTGTIKLDMDLANTHSVFRGTILKRGMMRTIINLVLEPGTVNIDVPVFSQDSMSEILSKHRLDGRGGYLFLELDEQIDTVDIDAAYDKKIYFNISFKEVESIGDAAYVLYVGVVPGNTLLKLRTVTNQYAEKVIHIVEDEVLVESPIATEASEQMLILKERNILAKEAKELEVLEHEIKYFNRNIKATQEASNMYKMKMPSHILGMRKYLELSHIGDTIYVGIWDHDTLEIPSRDFIENVMGALEIDNLQGRCLIQVNLKKELKNMTVSGDTIRGPMNIQHYYLDKDGTMTDEVSELAKKAFYVGDHQGIINVRMDYLDGTREYLQSFCSDETYLIEHL